MTNFGPAEEYNVFILGNLDLKDSDIGGRVCVCGDAALRDCSIGSQISAEPGTDTGIVIGGSGLLEGGRNCSGNTLCADATRLTSTMTHLSGAIQTGRPIDFDLARNEIIRTSMQWNSLPATGTVRTEGNRVCLYGDREGLNVFSLHSDRIDDSGLSLSQVCKIDIEIPDQACALIHINGTYIALNRCEITYYHIPAAYEEARNTIWHFPQALNWSCQHSSLWGAVVAPHASATVSESRIVGTAVFASLTGNGIFSSERFSGVLPDLPEETSLARQENERITVADERILQIDDAQMALPEPDKKLPEPIKNLPEPAKPACKAAPDFRSGIGFISIQEDRIDPCVICGEYRKCKCKPADKPALKIRITDANLWS